VSVASPACRFLPCLLTLSLLATAIAGPPAVTREKAGREGLAKFDAKYKGGYSVADDLGSVSGPGKVSFRAASTGQSARMQWKSTFYDKRGSHAIKIKWIFLAGGAMTATSINPSVKQEPAAGTYAVKGRRITFTCTADNGQTLTGEIRLVGRGTISINGTIPATPNGDVTIGFNAAR
jgi:hypothetical protein